VIERELERTRLEARVSLVGAVEPEQVRRELQAADIFVFPSGYESWGLALVEAMAVGVPALASDLPGTREAAGEAACLLPARKPAAWTDAIRRLIGDPAERRRLSLTGRERAALVTAESVVEQTENWLYRAVEG
jgi:glycosyltransferase involved in cell wall biosynthesis